MADRVRNVRNRRLPVILDAAEIEFSQKGYDGTSIQAVASRAGLTKMQIIHYFKTKENLYKEVIQRIFSETGFLDIHAKKGDPKQIFSDYIEQNLRLSKDKPHRSNLILTEGVRGAPVILRIYQEDQSDKVVALFKKKFDHWVETNQAPNVDVRLYLFLLWAAFTFYAAHADTVSFMMGHKKQMTNSDWNHIITQSKRILLAIFDSSESETTDFNKT